MIDFLVNYKDNQNPIALSYNTNGELNVQLPQGPDTDSFKIYLSVNVIDDTNGYTSYAITRPVIVSPNDELANNLADSIENNDYSSPLFVSLNSGNLNLVAKNVIALSTAFNFQSSSSSNSSSGQNNANSNEQNTQNNQVAQLRQYLVEKISSLSVSDISSIKVISTALSSSTTTPSQITTNTAVSKQINHIFKTKY